MFLSSPRFCGGGFGERALKKGDQVNFQARSRG